MNNEEAVLDTFKRLPFSTIKQAYVYTSNHTGILKDTTPDLFVETIRKLVNEKKLKGLYGNADLESQFYVSDEDIKK